MAMFAGTPPGQAPKSPAENEAGRRLPPWAGGVVGVGVLVVAWWLLAVTVLADGGAVPTPWELVRQMVRDLDFYPNQIEATVTVAVKGYLIGNGLAVGLAVVGFGVPLVEKVLLQIGGASYCLPIIAIGPILTTVFHGDAPRVALAGLSVFFTTLVGATHGLRAADAASLDVIRAAGGGPVRQMRHVRLRAALPSTFAALRIAAPAAVLGAIIGEFLGADSGLGIAMVTSQQSLKVARTWGLAIVASAVAGVGYALTALASRLATPWAPPRRPYPGSAPP
jgi:ABC-type nitrate/sulfonate/bicarbonate transport system permease component